MSKSYVEDSISEAEVTNVKYSPHCYGCTFFITLEALEDVIGVYETAVLCAFEDGRRTLLNFIRSPHPPVGGKFKGKADFISEKYRYEAVEEWKKALKAEPKLGCNAMKDDWLVPHKITGLHPTSVEHSCGGYDYYNPLTVFSSYMRSRRNIEFPC